MNNNIFYILLNFIIIFCILFDKIYNCNKSLCSTGDNKCQDKYGKESFCGIHQENPCCITKKNNEYVNTNNKCGCESTVKNNDNISFIILITFFLFFIIIFIFCSKKKIPIDKKLEFMFV